MKKLVIILICALYLVSCASAPVEKSEVPAPPVDAQEELDPILWYGENILTVDEGAILLLKIFDLLPNPLK
jgi:PBP1b-binding outer membrane lipoprotein LpoB